MATSRQQEIGTMLSRIEARPGWRIGPRRGGHYVVYPPCPPGARGRVIQIPVTPSDWRAMKNVRSALRRAGWPADEPL